MPLDLRSSFLKVKWAKDYISNLRDRRNTFLAQRHEGIPKFNPETNTTQYLLREVPVVEPDIRLMIGDIAHNLRTALDYLACELARSVGVIDPKPYFPIFECAKVYERESTGKTPGIPVEAKKFIDRIGPYGGHDDFLWALHELDRIDKHRLVLTATAKISVWRMSIRGTDSVDFAYSSDLKAGTVIGEVRGNHESDEQMSITSDIAFGEPEVLKGEAIFPTLHIIAERVIEVLTMFGPNPL